MIYRKLKRTWSHNYINYIPKFKKIFPELNKISSEDMCDRFIELGLDFYTEEENPVKWWIRFTLPFAIILLIAMLLFYPFYFIFTGNWGYPYNKNNWILNWFKSLKLLV
jgi:hypothetical protein